MPEQNYSGNPIINAPKSAAILNRFRADRSAAWSYVTLRSLLEKSLQEPSMLRQKPPPLPKAAPSKRPTPPPAAPFFLRTKLLPPRPAPEILGRPRLLERLSANLTLPVTLVTANAG